MGEVILEFRGLFLFHSNGSAGAAIDATKETKFKGKDLRAHNAWIEVPDGHAPTTWPKVKNGFELTDKISFVSSSSEPLHIDGWTLPKVKRDDGCHDFRLPPTYFERPKAGETLAVIELRTGTMCSFRYAKGAIGTRVTIRNVDRFVMSREDATIEYPALPAVAKFTFWNREIELSENDDDWLWYYKSTGHDCDAKVKAPAGKHGCPDEIDPDEPITLGCSNSNWP